MATRGRIPHAALAVSHRGKSCVRARGRRGRIPPAPLTAGHESAWSRLFLCWGPYSSAQALGSSGLQPVMEEGHRDGRWRSRSWSHASPPRHRSWDQGDGGATPPRGGEVKNLVPQWSWTRRSWGNEGPAAGLGRFGGPRRRVASGSGRDAEGGDKADAMRNRTRLNVIFST
jgi:hypothetical protein